MTVGSGLPMPCSFSCFNLHATCRQRPHMLQHRLSSMQADPLICWPICAGHARCSRHSNLLQVWYDDGAEIETGTELAGIVTVPLDLTPLTAAAIETPTVLAKGLSLPACLFLCLLRICLLRACLFLLAFPAVPPLRLPFLFFIFT